MTLLIDAVRAVGLVALALIVLAGAGAGSGAAAAGKATPALEIEDLVLDLALLPLDGQAPRPLRLARLDGKPLALADLKGRPVIVYFWASW
jgi:cytochrome oxidase Cu insertion factor (SCO1/SenC/PrrC family)